MIKHKDNCTGHVYLQSNTKSIWRVAPVDMIWIWIACFCNPAASSMDNVIYPEALAEREAGNRETLGQEMSRDVWQLTESHVSAVRQTAAGVEWKGVGGSPHKYHNPTPTPALLITTRMNTGLGWSQIHSSVALNIPNLLEPQDYPKDAAQSILLP